MVFPVLPTTVTVTSKVFVDAFETLHRVSRLVETCRAGVDNVVIPANAGATSNVKTNTVRDFIIVVSS
jgi:hypothetical protein